MTHQGHTVSTRRAPKVSVVVLTWNGRLLTLDCLESLAAITYPGLAVVVVDNASTDGTAAAIRDRFGDEITVVVNDSNLGFSGGNNVGIRRALEDGSDFVLLLNNDTVVDPGLIEGLVAVFDKNPRAGIVGPKIYYASPADQIWFAGGMVSLARGTARHIGIRETDHGQYDGDSEVDYVTGCALMARREVFESVGLLDEGYRAYYEDADFCLRARDRGYEIWYTSGGVLWHKISASTGGQVSARKIKQKLKSSLKFYGRHASVQHWLTIPFFFTVDVVRVVVLVLAGRIKDARSQKTTGESNT